MPTSQHLIDRYAAARGPMDRRRHAHVVRRRLHAEPAHRGGVHQPGPARADGVFRTTRPLVMPDAGVLIEDLVVTGSSRVRAAGVTFHNTLFDENTGGHVAWGQGFPFALPDGTGKSRDELDDAWALPDHGSA